LILYFSQLERASFLYWQCCYSYFLLLLFHSGIILLDNTTYAIQPLKPLVSSNEVSFFFIYFIFNTNVMMINQKSPVTAGTDVVVVFNFLCPDTYVNLLLFILTLGINKNFLTGNHDRVRVYYYCVY